MSQAVPLNGCELTWHSARSHGDRPSTWDIRIIDFGPATNRPAATLWSNQEMVATVLQPAAREQWSPDNEDWDQPQEDAFRARLITVANQYSETLYGHGANIEWHDAE